MAIGTLNMPYITINGWEGKKVHDDSHLMDIWQEESIHYQGSKSNEAVQNEYHPKTLFLSPNLILIVFLQASSEIFPSNEWSSFDTL